MIINIKDINNNIEMADNKLRVFKLRNQSTDELNKNLDTLKNELS